MKTFNIIILSIFTVLSHISCAQSEKKEIKASEIIKILKKGEAVQISNKIILDDLDFTNTGVPFIVNVNQLQILVSSNVFFNNCVFMGKVVASGVYKSLPLNCCFKNNLVFNHCDFRGDVNFENAVINGMLSFSSSTFREDVNCNGISVWAKDSYFSEIKAEKNFSMVYASFYGNVYGMDATFQNQMNMQETSIKGKLSFINALFKNKAGFDMLEVTGGVFFNYAQFEDYADFSYSRFYHTTDFIHSAFLKKAAFEKTFFLNTVRFEEIKTNENILFTDTYFALGKPIIQYRSE